MLFEMPSLVDQGTTYLMGVQIPFRHGKGQFWGGRACLTCRTTPWCELCKNGWTDWDAVWVMDSRKHAFDGALIPYVKLQLLGKRHAQAYPTTLPW